MKKILLVLTSLLVLSPLSSAIAASKCPPEIERQYANNPKAMPTCLENPLAGNITTAQGLIGTIIKGVLAVLGSLTLFMLVWGGFQWLTSAGNTEKVEKGTKTMFWAIIGVLLVFASYVLVDTLTTVLTSK